MSLQMSWCMSFDMDACRCACRCACRHACRCTCRHACRYTRHTVAAHACTYMLLHACAHMHACRRFQTRSERNSRTQAVVRGEMQHAMTCSMLESRPVLTSRAYFAHVLQLCAGTLSSDGRRRSSTASQRSLGSSSLAIETAICFQDHPNCRKKKG